MDQYMYVQGPTKTSVLIETSVIEKDILTDGGFSAEESLAVLWLRQWYQTGGSDRAAVLRHLEFLKKLLSDGKIDL